MHVASVPAPATECHALRVRPTRAHSRPPVARAMTPVGFCFALRERACADPQTSRSHVVLSSSELGASRDARIPREAQAGGFEQERAWKGWSCTPAAPRPGRASKLFLCDAGYLLDSRGSPKGAVDLRGVGTAAAGARRRTVALRALEAITVARLGQWPAQASDRPGDPRYGLPRASR